MLCIRNGRIHDGRGQVRVADLLIDEGKIIKIGDAISAEGAEIIDASQKEVFPGFIDPLSDWGILRPGMEIRGNAADNDERSQVLTPEANVIYAFNGRGISRQQIYAFGITAVGVAPSNSNLFGGQMAAFEVLGINPMNMILRQEVGMKASVCESVKKTYGSRNLTPMTKMGIFSMFKEKLQEAKEYDPTKETTKRDEKLAALKKVIDKKMPLFVTCNSAQEIHSVLKATEGFDLDLVFCNGYGIDESLGELAKKKAGIILGDPSNGFNKFVRSTNYQAIYQLAKQGCTVSFCASSDGFGGREQLLWSALEMMKVIHDEEAVLSMMTYNAAKLLGIDSFTGSIEEGKRADLVIWSDNPLKSYRGHVEQTLIQGKVVYTKGDEMKCFL